MDGNLLCSTTTEHRSLQPRDRLRQPPLLREVRNNGKQGRKRAVCPIQAPPLASVSSYVKQSSLPSSSYRTDNFISQTTRVLLLTYFSTPCAVDSTEEQLVKTEAQILKTRLLCAFKEQNGCFNRGKGYVSHHCSTRCGAITERGGKGCLSITSAITLPLSLSL